MSLTERHRWCLAKIQECFALSQDVGQAFIRQEVNLQKFNQFFRGEGSGRIFILYQPELVEGEVF